MLQVILYRTLLCYFELQGLPTRGIGEYNGKVGELAEFHSQSCAQKVTDDHPIYDR